jgi:hypothetical protein
VHDDGSGAALFACGQFTLAGGASANHIAKWDGTNWSALGLGLPSNVYALASFDDGSGPALFVGGQFTFSGQLTLAHIAKWNGSAWSAVAGGVDGIVISLCVHDDGSGPALYVGGAYGAAGPHPSTGLSRWDGHNWTSIDGVECLIDSMVSFDDGGGPALFVAGYLYWVQPGTLNEILYWRGGAWHAFSSPPLGVYSLCVFDDGSGPKLYAGGGVPGSPGISRWNGTQWSGVGGGLNSYVFTMVVHDDGSGPKLYAGGQFTAAGGQPALRVARWDGTSWSAVGTGMEGGQVYSLASFSDGFGGPPKLIALGTFTSAGGAPANHIASWDGASWSPLGSGLDGLIPYAATSGLGVYDDGQGSGRDLYVGGHFTSAGGQPVSSFAKWEGCGGTGTPFCPGDGSLATACPCANSGAVGHGCASSQVAAGGLLQASGLPTPDTIVLAASELRPGASCIFLQGDAQLGAGALFGDGLRCAGGQLLRLALKSATNGNASYPEAGDLGIRARSAALGAPIPSPASRYYQVYYRDSDASFCPAPQGNTWNITNAMRIVW